MSDLPPSTAPRNWAIFAAVLVLYVLSSGPAMILVIRDSSWQNIVLYTYAPLEGLPAPAHHLLIEYMRWWIKITGTPATIIE